MEVNGSKNESERARERIRTHINGDVFVCERTRARFDTNGAKHDFMYLLDILTMCVMLLLTTNHNLEQKNTLKAL